MSGPDHLATAGLCQRGGNPARPSTSVFSTSVMLQGCHDPKNDSRPEIMPFTFHSSNIRSTMVFKETPSRTATTKSLPLFHESNRRPRVGQCLHHRLRALPHPSPCIDRKTTLMLRPRVEEFNPSHFLILLFILPCLSSTSYRSRPASNSARWTGSYLSVTDPSCWSFTEELRKCA